MPQNEKLRNGLLIIISMIISLLFDFIGLLFHKSIHFGSAASIIIVILFFAMAIGNFLWCRSFTQKLNASPVKDQMDSLLTRHQSAQTGLEPAIHRLKKIQNNILAYFFTLLLLACALAFFCGTTGENHIAFTLLSMYVIYGVLYCFSPVTEEFDETLYVTEEDYPYLYEIAYRAMHALDISGSIRIMILPDWNAGIAKMNDFFSLQLGAEMLYMLTEEELYHVLLHEFSHLADPYSREYLTPKLLTRLQRQELTSDMATITLLLIKGPNYYYSYESEVFEITTSKIMERRADMKACTVGNASVYASALVKMALREYFDFESNDYLKEPYYEPEQPRENVTTLMTSTFAKALSERKEDWLATLEKQLPPVMDSHPSFGERYASIGKPVYKLVFPDNMCSPSIQTKQVSAKECTQNGIHGENSDKKRNSQIKLESTIDTCPSQNNIRTKKLSREIDKQETIIPAYKADCQKAIKHADKMIFDQLSENYKEEREEHYLKPLQTVEHWKKAGSNIQDTNISDVIKALDSLCLYEEAENLCDQIISDSENVYMMAFPLLYKGNRMLHRYDKTGIDLIYRSIDLNSNLTGTGMDMIGSYCQQMGLEKELKEYRKKVPEYSQKEMDYDSNSGEISKNDHLIPEQFPDNRLDVHLNYMLEAGQNSIDKIYLVRKVIDTEHFFSIFVIKWKSDTTAEILSNGMNRIFNHLDTYPDGWPYSLFLWDMGLEKILRKVEHSCIYEAAKDS